MLKGRAGAVLLSLLLGQLWQGCSTPNPNVRVRRLNDGRLQVDGPLSGPFNNLEALADSACSLMTSQPAASTGKVGFEYCALYYYSIEDKAFFLSYLSDVAGNLEGGKKFCEVPRALHELNQKTAILLGPGHTHSINREFSPGDLSKGREEGWSPLGSSRFHNQETGRIWERELLLFYKEWNGVCRAYKYNYATRIVQALREGGWVPIGRVEGRNGQIHMLDGQDWLP